MRERTERARGVCSSTDTRRGGEKGSVGLRVGEKREREEGVESSGWVIAASGPQHAAC